MYNIACILVCVFLLLLWMRNAGALRNIEHHIFFVWACSSLLISLNIWETLRYRWILAVLVAGYGVWMYVRNRRVKINPIFGIWIMLLVWIFVSVFWSVLPAYTGFRALGLVLVLSFAGFGGSVFVSTPQGRRAIFFTLCAISIGLVPILLSGFSGEGSVARYTAGGGILKATGTATTALNCAIASFYFSYTLKSTKKYYSWALIGLAMLLVILSRTRGTLLISTILLPGLWFALRNNQLLKRKGAVLKIALVYVLFALFGIVFWALSDGNQQQAFKEHLRISSSEEAAGTRVEGRWDVAAPKSLERPFFGRGFGSSRFFLYSDEELTDVEMVGVNPDLEPEGVFNQYLCIFYEMGLVGLLIFLTPIFFIGKCALYLIRFSPPRERLMNLTMIAFWGHEVLGMMFHDGKLTVGNITAYWFIIESIWLYQAWRHAKKYRRAQRSMRAHYQEKSYADQPSY